jgi:hypothetical protein
MRVLHQTNVFKRLKVAVNSREVDAGMSFADFLGYFFGSCMTKFADSLKHEFALGRKT